MISRTHFADLRRFEEANRRGLQLQMICRFLDQRSGELEIEDHAPRPADPLGRVVFAVRLLTLGKALFENDDRCVTLYFGTYIC
jgi:hypothetical protein